MARTRNKEYSVGDRINIYLSRDLTPEFVDWINKQSDLSNFFLYAAQQLYQQTGFVDVSEVMPRKINYDLTSEVKTPQSQGYVIPTAPDKANTPETTEPPNVNEHKQQIENKDLEPEVQEKGGNWSNLNLDDDPFA